MFAKAQRTPTNEGEVFDGPAIVKEIDLANRGEKSKPVYIVEDLTKLQEIELTALLKEVKDVLT